MKMEERRRYPITEIETLPAHMREILREISISPDEFKELLVKLSPGTKCPVRGILFLKRLRQQTLKQPVQPLPNPTPKGEGADSPLL
jgi:hypothetical protein